MGGPVGVVGIDITRHDATDRDRTPDLRESARGALAKARRRLEPPATARANPRFATRSGANIRSMCARAALAREVRIVLKLACPADLAMRQRCERGASKH